MLGNRTASKTSTFVIPTVDDVGQPIAAVSARYELLDARGALITGEEITTYMPNAVDVSFEIAGQHLSLPSEVQTAGREIVVYLTAFDGDVTEIRNYFLIVSAYPLAVMQNSFLTYAEALALRTEFASLPGWDGKDPTQHAAALSHAYRSLCKVSFKVPGYLGGLENMDKAWFGTGAESPFYDHGGRHVRLAMLTVEEFDGMAEAFTRAVKRAQLVEADTLLGGDPIGDKRRAGLISETVGESSSFFQSKPYLNLPICRAAYEEVRRYIYLRVGIHRA
jgi:hypothetical protein